MINSYVPAETKILVEHELVFDDGHNNGFGFPCDANGKVFDLQPETAQNLAYCLKCPQEFKRWNEVVTTKRYYKEPAHGTCVCGTEVELYDQYYGACQCPNCGRWYNLFGQSLLPPEQWERDPSEEEYW